MRDLKKLIALGGLVLAVGALAQAADPPAADPIPFRRVELTPAEAAEQEARIQRGELTPLPREQFEDLLRRARAADNPPRLMEARFRGRLVDAALEGAAEWKVINPTGVPALLPVQPLGLALRHARWQGGESALLGNLQGGLGLWVERPGESILEVGWSARSNPVTGGLRFTFDVPPCAIGLLELELPSDRAISVSRDAFFLSGPLPTSTPQHQLWRLGFSGRTQVNFVVRQTTGAGLPAPLVLARQYSRQVLTPGELKADFDFELEVYHSGITRLVCECDPGLRPYHVSIRNLESWSLKAGKTPAGPSQLIIRLREPFQGGVLQVKCLAGVTPGASWTAPAIRLTDAVVREESLSLQVDPEVQLENWQPGSFRLLHSSIEPDGRQLLNLSSGIESAAGAVRPQARLATTGPEFGVRQATWWELAADRQRLTSRLALEVTRGRLFRLPLQLPPGWTVEQVEMTPADRLGAWSVIPDKAKPLLMVDLVRSLDPASSARLTVRLRRDPAGGALAFPDIVPQGARQREGALGISVSSSYQAAVTASVPAVVGKDDETLRPPWGKQALDYYYPFRGRPVEGTLTLRSRGHQVRAVCTHDLVVAARRALLTTRLELHPEAGAARQVDLFISGPDLGTWDWRTLRGTNQVERQERMTGNGVSAALTLLAARDPWQAVGLAHLPRPRGTWWRITLARPLSEPVTLEARHELAGRAASAALAAQLLPLASLHPLDTVAGAPVRVARGTLESPVWDVPLVCVTSAERMDGTVTLHLAGTSIAQVEATGLREVASGRPARGQSALPWRTYRYSQPPAALTLRGGDAAPDQSGLAIIDTAALTSYLEPTGRLVHHFRFRIRDWTLQSIPVRLPADVQLLAARSDGSWLFRLPPARTSATEREYELPVAHGTGPRQFELLYAHPPAPFALWQRLEAPAPALPVDPLTLERTWCLPPGVAPLVDSSLQRLPGEVGQRRWLSSIGVSDAGQPWQARQEKMLTDAILAIRKERPADETWTLGEVLERLAIDHFRDRLTLVIDTEALADLNIGPATPLPASAWENKGEPWSPANFPLPVPWESVDVVYVPCPAGAVLTTRPWQLAWLEDPLLPGSSIEQAVAEAVRQGQDSSGRFRPVLQWLDRPRSEPFNPAEILPLAGDGLEDGWTAWEPLPGSASPTLLVLRPGAVPLVGIMLGLVLAFAAVRLGPQPGRRRFRLFLIWLAIGALGLVWLPPALKPLAWGPAVVGMLVGLIWCSRLALGLRRATAAASAAGLLSLFCIYPQAQADPSWPIVYFLPESAGGKAQVLAPPDLLAQLKKQAAPPLTGAHLLAAEYQGRVNGSQAHFEARYRLHSFDDQPTAVLVPLTGVQLVDATLDDRPAQPIIQEGGYSVGVPGSGEHWLTLRFTVALPQGEDRDLRFGIPELPQSRFVLETADSASYLHVVDARGGQRVVTDGSKVRLEADLGQVAAVRARWRQEDGPSQRGVLRVREGYYWELKPTSARLLAVLQYTVSQGWFSGVAIELPRELEVVSVEAGPLPGTPAAPRLKDWTLQPMGNKRRLQIEFAGPVTASVLVTLELVPRQPLGRNANLPFPSPVDGQTGRGFLAYRLEDLVAPIGQEKALAITGMKKDEQEIAFNEWVAAPWALARQEKLLPPSRFFWRMKGGVLQLNLFPTVSPARSSQELSWRIDPRQASLQASVTVTAPEPNLQCLQWEVPAGLQVAEVSGPQLAHWTRTGNRIQAWLRKPTAQAQLQLSGWLPRPAKAPPRFDLPLVRMLDMTESQTELRVSTAENLALKPDKLNNLTPRSVGDDAGRELHYTATQAVYGGGFQLLPARPSATFQVLTVVTVRDRQLSFNGIVDCTIHPGGLKQLMLSLRNWDDGPVQVTAAGATVEERRAAAGRLWLIGLPPTAARSLTITLHGQVPLENLTEAAMPDLRVVSADEGRAPQERWLAVAGSEIEAVGAAGLEAAALPAWPREAERLRRNGGTSWKVRQDDWRLRLLPRGPAVTPVQLLLAEYEAAAGGATGWLHRATYWLAHEGGADLALTLHDGARILGVQVNGVPAPPLWQAGGRRLWLPLTGGAGVQFVEVLWTTDQESVERPNLEPPRLEGVAAGPQVWTIQVPAGYQLGPDEESEWSVRRSSVACLDLSRADATLRQMAWLAERPGSDSGPSAQAFDRHIRFAEHRLAQAEGDDREALAAWLERLRTHRASLKAGPVEPAARGTPTATGSGWPPLVAGHPAYWYGPADAGPPPVMLVSTASVRLQQTATLTVLIFAVLFGSWILASLFGAAAWPEQLALLGVLGWLVFGGVGLVFLALPAASLLIRLYDLVRLAWQLVRRRPAAAPTA